MDWSPRYSIGVKVLDEQHQELFRRLGVLVEALCAGDLSEATRLLEFLETYTVEHFALEEQEMVAAKYPGLAAHLEAHAQFIELMGNLRLEFVKSGATPWFATRLEGAVSEWIKRHLLGVDLEFGKFLLAREERARTR